MGVWNEKEFLDGWYFYSVMKNDCTVLYLSQGLVQLFYHMLNRDTLYITEEKLLGKKLQLLKFCDRDKGGFYFFKN